jgi:hypothetical protein
MRAPLVTAALAAIMLTAPALSAQAGSGPAFQVDYSNPSITPSHWTLTFSVDGSGHFRSERGGTPASDPPVMEAPNVDRDISLSGPFAAHVFQVAQSQIVLGRECESHMKVAFQGWKKIHYAGPEGEWSCEFNYSRDKQVQALGDSLVAVASTILEGARLETLLQHDRLGLDHETQFMLEASGDGRLLQLGAIRSILERLAADDQVMDRVRKRAKQLLARADK